MRRIYEIYKYTRFVEKKNDETMDMVYTTWKAGKPLNKSVEDEIDRQMGATVVSHQFSETRIFLFKKLGAKKAFKIHQSALKNGYVNLEDPKDRNSVIQITTPKGENLIDGLPILRIGLWNAWYKEYGGLFAFLTSGAVVATVLFLAKFVWHQL